MQAVCVTSWSLQAGHVRTCEVLLNFGARLNKQDGEGNTALMLSSISKAVGATECMMKMVEVRSHNLNLDVKNNMGFTALHLAAAGELFRKFFFIKHKHKILLCSQ